ADLGKLLKGKAEPIPPGCRMRGELTVIYSPVDVKNIPGEKDQKVASSLSCPKAMLFLASLAKKKACPKKSFGPNACVVHPHNGGKSIGLMAYDLTTVAAQMGHVKYSHRWIQKGHCALLELTAKGTVCDFDDEDPKDSRELPKEYAEIFSVVGRKFAYQGAFVKKFNGYTGNTDELEGSMVWRHVSGRHILIHQTQHHYLGTKSGTTTNTLAMYELGAACSLKLLTPTDEKVLRAVPGNNLPVKPKDKYYGP
ncbi:hypothetical protein KKF84_12365, partial [Myxococcota bacterium]|nr:hypothetical protein [Myxococcota bacterium]MBU1536109.1 hypothetical protein [Myxococcota bacterium]